MTSDKAAVWTMWLDAAILILLAVDVWWDLKRGSHQTSQG